MKVGTAYKLSNPIKLKKDPLGAVLYNYLKNKPVFTVIEENTFSVVKVKFMDGTTSENIEFYNPVLYALSHFYIPSRLYDCFDTLYPSNEESTHIIVSSKKENTSSILNA